jgi:CRISPR/Cas system-associated exonuclease Cas4 (RecB family)
MKTFHQSLVDRIRIEDLPSLKNHCYVFPTKRGGVFFKQNLLTTFKGENFFLPAILSIEEFVEKLTNRSITDELTLLFELYKIYQKRDKLLDFDRFYAWGKIILKDYDEIDRYMADAKQIYHGLQELKEIENVFGFNDELREIVANFRTITDKKEKTKLLTEFLKIWEAVGHVYKEFRVSLDEKSLCYGGILYRNLAESIGKPDFKDPYEQYHICGFNALSKSEESIFDQLIHNGKGQIYWDADQLYLEDTREEAGNFLREYRDKWPESVWFTEDSLSQNKTVSISAVPQSIGQGHLGAQILSEGATKGWRPEHTAIVLADEKLLLPVLYAIPFDEHKVNVTMGYPVRFTVAFDLVESYLELFRKSVIKGNEVLVYVYDLKPLLSNAYMSLLEPRIYEKVINWCIKEKKTRVSIGELVTQLESSKVKALLSASPNWEPLFEQIKSYFFTIFYHFKELDENPLDREFIYFFLKEFNKIAAYLSERTEQLSLKLIKKIVKEHFKVAKIPFEGVPVEGFQIMGFLETRTLDFKNVIVLSANEGKLPAQRSMNTYIPFALRRAYGLPTFEEQDAIYAYHFKRLLQRAENIHFTYDSEVSKDSSGEKSRFILQLMRKYEGLSNIIVNEEQYTGRLQPVDNSDRAIIVNKTPEVISNMDRYLVGSEDGKFLSPSSLITYITCPLRFYFQNVLRIRETDDVEEDIDARNFGIVVHRVLELLYQPWLNKEMSASDIKGLEKLVAKKVADVLAEEKIIQENQTLIGKDVLTQSIMQRLVLKILQYDQKQAPFKVTGLERNNFDYQISLEEGRSARLGGVVDRIDEKEGITRIIDYKTGNVTLAGAQLMKKPIDEYMDAYFTDPKLKSGFQGYFYGLLAKKELINDFQVGILGMRQLGKGVQWLQQGRTITPDLMVGFESRLESLVQGIYDPKKSFTQTDDNKRCEYCPYNRICHKV